MSIDRILVESIQSAALFLIVWITFRLLPAIPANTKAWTWRIALLKPLIGLLPLAVVSLHVLPTHAGALVSATVTYPQAPFASTGTVAMTPAERLLLASDDPVNLLPIVWLTGAAAIGVMGLRGWCWNLRVARSAKSVSCPVLQKHLAELVDRAPKRKWVSHVELRASAQATTAMLMRGRKPAIILPLSVVGSSSREDARLMIAHELAHLVRRDLEWLGAAWVVQSLFFFNPLVWLAIRASQDAHESAADSYAVELSGVPAPQYAEMLIRSLVEGPAPFAPGAVFVSGSYRSIHRRLEAMKHFRSPFTSLRKSAFGALALTVACLMPAYQLAQASPSFQEQGRGTSAGGSSGKIPGSESWSIQPLDPSAPDLVSCQFQQYDVRLALEKLFKQHHKTFKMDPHIHGGVTISLRNVPLDVCVANLTRQVDASFTIKKAVYLILNRPPAPLSATPPPTTTQPVSEVHVEKLVSLEAKREDVRQVLRRLFRLVGASYAIAPDIQGTVSASFKNAPFDEVLQKVLRPVKGKFDVQGGVYVMSRIGSSRVP